jgi:Flp pilus assembly protein TadG
MTHRGWQPWDGTSRPRLAVARRRWADAHRRRARRGSAILEFSILLPLLLTIVLLCVDFGRFAHYYIAVTNAARAGAAYGSSHAVAGTSDPTWAGQVRQAVRDELGADNWSADEQAKLAIAAPVVTRDVATGDWRVQVDVRYEFHTLVNWPFLPGYNTPLVLQRRVVMRGTI